MREDDAAGRGLAMRLSLFFGALFLVNGVHLTYLPVWLDARGLSPTAIAVVTSLPMLVRLVVTPGIAFAADRTGAHRSFIITASVAGLILMCVLAVVSLPLVVGVLVVLMLISLQTIMPMADTITLAATRNRGLDYGRVRLWGSVTFIAASYAAGFSVAGFGAETVIWLSIAAAAATVVAALLLPRPQDVGGAGPSRKRLTVADAVALARDPVFILFVVTVGLMQGSHAVLYVFGVLHWRGQGLSDGFIATLWAIGVIAEIVLFWAARYVKGLGAVALMLTGGAAGIVRWLALSGDPGAFALVVLQVLHAGTFGAVHLGAMQWIATRVPPETTGTAQALLSTFTTGIAMGGAMLLSGPLYTRFEGRSYLAMAAMCAIGMAAGLVLLRREGRTEPNEPRA